MIRYKIYQNQQKKGLNAGKCKHPIKYTIKKGCISFQVKQPSMVVSPSFFIPFFPFVWQHL